MNCPKCAFELHRILDAITDKEINFLYCSNCKIIYQTKTLFNRFGFYIFRFKSLKEK